MYIPGEALRVVNYILAYAFLKLAYNTLKMANSRNDQYLFKNGKYIIQCVLFGACDTNYFNDLSIL